MWCLCCVGVAVKAKLAVGGLSPTMSFDRLTRTHADAHAFVMADAPRCLYCRRRRRLNHP